MLFLLTVLPLLRLERRKKRKITAVKRRKGYHGSMIAFFDKYYMNLAELTTFKLNDAIFFNEELNPAIWQGENMIPEVREALLIIADDFIEHLGLDNLEIEDITISGSNAAYTYTKHSDIDLHILVNFNKLHNDAIYRELFDAKKTIYNDNHEIKIGGYDVELYVQDTNQPVISLGEYSVLNGNWLKLPKKQKATLDQNATKQKFNKLNKLADLALKYDDEKRIKEIIATIKKYRKSGLDRTGEFGPENLAFKALRSQGIIKKLFQRYNTIHSEKLSLPESASGYIPSEKEKNDPRWKTGLSVDVKPSTIKDNAKKLGSKISRAGIPPLLR